MLNKWLERDIIPCWYELGWKAWRNDETPAIFLRVHKDFVRSIKTIPETAPLVTTLRGEFFNTLFDTFSGSLEKDFFGFNKVFERVGEVGEFIEFLIRIPVINKPTRRKCPECRGTKKNQFLEGQKCFHCEGKGKEYQIDWRLAYSVSASFTVFTALSEYSEIETSCRLPQLLTFRTITVRNMHGGSLGGNYSIPLVKWLSSLGRNTQITAMIYAMKSSYQRMLGKREYDNSYFQAYVANEKGWLNVSCPGSACGLHPADGYLEEGEGYQFSCHNVDSPMQQLTLIAGLAALHEKARRDIALYGSG